MIQRVAINNFTGGEISAWGLASRYDIAKYKTACKKIRNFICELHGSLRRRPGTFFCEDLGATARLIPFQFSTDPNQTYALVFQTNKIRIAQGFGFVTTGTPAAPVEVVTTYAEADLGDITYAQSGDVVYLAHKNYALQKLVRSSHTSWALIAVAFAPTQPTPAAPTVNFSGSGSFSLRYVIAAESAAGVLSLGSPAGVDTGAKHPSDWVVGDSCTVTWSAVTGAARYLIYREEAGYYGLVGVAEGALTFTDVKYKADTTDTPKESNLPFANGNNPSLVGFHEQRLVLANGALKPQTFYGSQTGDFENFCKSRPLKDDDPYEFTISSGSIDAVQWMASFGDLLLGTGGVEYKAQSGDASITPTNVKIKAQSYWGSKAMRPLIIGNSVLHVQRQGSRVRDLFFSLEKDGYAGNDLSVLAPHLFDGYDLSQWAYQQSPGSVIWVVRDDGTLLGLSYLKEHEIWGWHVHTTDGLFESVCTTTGLLEDAVWLVVKRTINGYTRYFLERMATKWQADTSNIGDAMFLDCAGTYSGAPSTYITGLDRFNGDTVDALVDGSPVVGLTVAGGAITLPYAGSKVHVGLPYTSVMIPNTPEADTQQGSTLGKIRAYGRCTVRLIDTVGGQYGPDEDNLYDMPSTPENWGEAVQPNSWDEDFAPGGGFLTVASVCIAQPLPLPMTVAALMLEVDIEG